MQKCNYRSENDYFQVEQFTSRSFKVRSIFHTLSWTQITMFLHQKVWKQFRKIALHKTQLTHCSPIRLDIFIEGHFYIKSSEY